MTLPSKYSSHSRNFRAYFAYLIMGGIFATVIYFGILRSIEKYGPEFLDTKSALVLVGLSAGFTLTLMFSRRLFVKIIRKSRRDMTMVEYLFFRYGSRLLAFVIIALVFLFIGYLATENLSLDP